MHRSTWKRAERTAAKLLGGRRVPFSGGLAPESGLPKSDMMGGLLALFPTNEVKHRKTWAVMTWIRQLRERSKPHGYWLLVIGTPEMHGQFAVLPLERLAELVGEGLDRRSLPQGADQTSLGGASETAPPRP